MANIDYFCNYFNQKIPYDLDDISINIYNHSIEEIENFLQIPHEVCKYCDTITRKHTYQHFDISKKDIKEWII